MTGHRSKLRTPKDFLSSVMKIIIELAPQHLYKTGCIYIHLGSGGGGKRYTPAGFAGSLRDSNMQYLHYEDHARQERLLQQTSLEWTGIRAVGIDQFKKKGGNYCII